MGPVTTARTPRWVVEGFAEYVAYKKDNVPATGIRQALGDLVISTLPTDEQTKYLKKSGSRINFRNSGGVKGVSID